MTKISFSVIDVLAVIFGLYPAIYFVIDRSFGLLSTKPNVLLLDSTWNVSFYTHIILAGIALIAGWSQFSSNLRINKVKVHRLLGMCYIGSVILSSIAGGYLSFFATAGLVSTFGFLFLAILWLVTTIWAYICIKNRNYLKHYQMMTISYSLCFAAVTLRIWLPILILIFGNFNTSYQIVAWLCWVPNFIFGYLLLKSNTFTLNLSKQL